MTEYIYIVKCDGCEDEMFNFFTDARMQCDLVMSKHPIITQIEVERNDFGECTNSCDLGTVWSWEEAMKDTCTDAEPAKCIFTKDDLKDYVPEEDSEFDALDNSVDFEVSETADVSTDNAKKCKSLKRASYLKEGSYVTLSETDQLTRESLYDQIVNKKAVIEIDIGDHYNPEICFDDGGCYSNSVLAVSYTVDGLFEIDMWHYSDDGEVTDDLDYEFSTNSFEDCLEELTSFMPDLLVEWRKRAVPEEMAIEQQLKEDKYAKDLAKRMKALTSEDNDKSSKKKFGFGGGKSKNQIATWKVVQTTGLQSTVEDGFLSEVEAAQYVRDHGGVSKLKVVKNESFNRKPIPEEMTIEQLVEEMEENEDTVECTWCEELFDKSECRKEVDLGWLCSRCEAAIKSRGEPLTFKENNYFDFLDEAADSNLDLDYSEDNVELTEISNSPLVLCPECGKEAFDPETGICVDCGFN